MISISWLSDCLFDLGHLNVYLILVIWMIFWSWSSRCLLDLSQMMIFISWSSKCLFDLGHTEVYLIMVIGMLACSKSYWSLFAPSHKESYRHNYLIFKKICLTLWFLTLVQTFHHDIIIATLLSYFLLHAYFSFKFLALVNTIHILKYNKVITWCPNQWRLTP